MKSFASSHQLAQHLRIHSGDKPYKCNYCDKAFKQLSHVQQHTRLHTGERPYKCSISECGRAFIQLSNLQQHMRTHMNKSENGEREGRKRYVATSACPVCAKTYVNEGSLRKHIQTAHANVTNNANNASINHDSNQQQQHQQQQHVELVGQLNGDVLNTGSAAALGLLACSVCRQMFTSKDDLLQHMEQMRTDPKHQFEAQILLSCAAAERRSQQNQNISNGQSNGDNENQSSNSSANLNQVENLVIMNNMNGSTVQDNMQKYVVYYVQK